MRPVLSKILFYRKKKFYQDKSSQRQAYKEQYKVTQMSKRINRVEVIGAVKDQRIEPADKGYPKHSIFSIKKINHINTLMTMYAQSR